MIPLHASLPLADLKRMTITCKDGAAGFQVFCKCEECKRTLRAEAAELRAKGLHGMANWVDPDV